MLITALSVVAAALTVLRSWPQFVRIVVRQNTEGVSALTWSLTLAAHTGWCMLGVLTPIPLFILVNTLAGAGCFAILTKIRSWQPALIIVGATVAISFVIFRLSDVAFLIGITALQLIMFVPQAIRILREKSDGVSLVAWSIATLASASWIAWAIATHRPQYVVAHYFMMTTAMVIVFKAWRERRLEVEEFDESPILFPEL